MCVEVFCSGSGDSPPLSIANACSNISTGFHSCISVLVFSSSVRNDRLAVLCRMRLKSVAVSARFRVPSVDCLMLPSLKHTISVMGI